MAKKVVHPKATPEEVKLVTLHKALLDGLKKSYEGKKIKQTNDAITAMEVIANDIKYIDNIKE